MTFSNKALAAVFGYSERTYYRRKKSKGVTIVTVGNIMTEAEARNIAEKLGFKKEFDEFLKQHNR